MSHEEHAALGGIRADIAELRSGQQHLTAAVADFVRASKEQIGETRGELRELAKSYGESRAFKPTSIVPILGIIVTLGGPAVGFLAMRNSLGPIQTQNRVSEVDRAGLHEEVKTIQAALVSGKEARLNADKEQSVKNAVQDERIAELYFQQHGHYPSSR